MHPAASRSDDFQAWLKSENGQRCADMPVTSREFLVNRLWWAFNAGREAERKEKEPQ